MSAIGTGVQLEIPSGYYGKIEGRSGLALKGIHPLGGVIDSDYRGELKVILRNGQDVDYDIRKGTRIAQLCILPCTELEWKEVSTLSNTARGCQGFGSTG